ncbi:Spy/CpxP family protein refolding chaperone, partial [candidate division KSB1 bacterium]
GRGGGWGGGRGMGMGMGRGMALNYYSSGVYPAYTLPQGMSQEQMTKINELDLSYQNDYATLSNKLTVLYTQMQNLQAVNPPDYNAIQRKIDEIAELEAGIQKRSIEYDRNLMDTYTPEQRQLMNTAQVNPAAAVNPYYGRGVGGIGGNMGYGSVGGGFTMGAGVPYGTNALGGPRLGRGPCGFGFNKFGGRWGGIYYR